jgi:hypothetical protein
VSTDKRAEVARLPAAGLPVRDVQRLKVGNRLIRDAAKEMKENTVTMRPGDCYVCDKPLTGSDPPRCRFCKAAVHPECYVSTRDRGEMCRLCWRDLHKPALKPQPTETPVPADMKTVTYQGKTYPCPLSPRFRRHDEAERERMDESGDIEYPVLLYRDTDLELDNCVMDGEGRLETAARTGAALKFEHRGGLTTDAAYKRAVALNDARRHDDPESIRQRRADRVERRGEARVRGLPRHGAGDRRRRGAG